MMQAVRVRGAVLLALAAPVAGCGGWVNVDTALAEQTGGASGESDASGPNGAPTPADPNYGFQVIPGLLEAGENGKLFDSVAREVSYNGALVVGTTSEVFPPLDKLPEFGADLPTSSNSRYFYWTPETGSQPWEGPGLSLCLSGNGGAIFSYAAAAAGNSTAGFTRWTPEEGFQTIGDAATYPDAQISNCSDDGKTAAGHFGGLTNAPTGDMRAVLWAEGRLDDQVAPVEPSPQVPDGAFGWVSSVGSVSIVTSYGTPNHIYWKEGDEEFELLPQPAEGCTAAPASRDGKVVLSFCSEGGGNHVYRWTAETRTFTSMGTFGWADWENQPSPDGSTLAAVSGSRLAYLKAGTRVDALADAQLSLLGLDEDGSTVYLQVYGAVEKATRWTEADGFVPLESLPGLPCTELTYAGTEGLYLVAGLAVGLSSTQSQLGNQTCGWSDARAVLWDSLGARDIAAELKAAGVNLEGVELRRADRVWAGERIRVMGTGQLSSGARRTWLAELPARG